MICFASVIRTAIDCHTMVSVWIYSQFQCTISRFRK